MHQAINLWWIVGPPFLTTIQPPAPALIFAFWRLLVVPSIVASLSLSSSVLFLGRRRHARNSTIQRPAPPESLLRDVTEVDRSAARQWTRRTGKVESLPHVSSLYLAHVFASHRHYGSESFPLPNSCSFTCSHLSLFYRSSMIWRHRWWQWGAVSTTSTSLVALQFSLSCDGVHNHKARLHFGI